MVQRHGSMQNRAVEAGHSPGEPTIDTFRKVISTAGSILEVGLLFLNSPRDKLRALDKAAIGLATIVNGLSIYDIWREEKPVRGLTNFVNERPEEFTQLGCAQAEMFLHHLPPHVETVVVRGYENVRLTTAAPGVLVAYQTGETTSPRGVSVRDAWTNNIHALAQCVREQLWTALGQQHIEINSSDESPEPFHLVERSVGTRLVEELYEYTKPYVDAGRFQSILINGQFGTGKSHAAVLTAERLGLRSMSISAWTFSNFISRGVWIDDAQYGLGMQIQAYRPDVIVLNDIERIDEDYQLRFFPFLESMRHVAKLVIVTTNRHTKLVDALLRPGRIDEVMTAHGVTLEEVYQLAPALTAHSDIAASIVDWPVTHVVAVQEAIDVRGLSAGLAQVEKLRARLNAPPAGMAGMVDAAALKAVAERREGSTPSPSNMTCVVEHSDELEDPLF